MKTKIIIFFVVIFYSVFLFNSCEKEKIDKQNNNNLNEEAFIVRDGILMFKSSGGFLETISAIANLNDTERKSWEESIGFLSQRRIISNIISEEIILDSINESRYGELKELNIADIKLHSDTYYKYLNKGVIKIIDQGTDNEYWDVSVFNRGFIDFINEDGLFTIGDTIFCVKENSFKILTDGDLTKINLLLNAKSPDEYQNIVFLNTSKNLKSTAGIDIIESGWVSSGGGKQGEKRIKIGVNLEVLYYIPSDHVYYFYHEVFVQCQERNWLRNWVYKFTEVSVNGSWGIRMFEHPINYFSNSFSYNGGVSYLKACVNPQSGESAPYRSVFHVMATYPSAWDEYHQPYFTDFNWSALRNGGCCGLTATITLP